MKDDIGGIIFVAALFAAMIWVSYIGMMGAR